MGELLSVKNINVYYGSIHAIKDVSFHVDEGEIVTLIGANGAGKTTTMHAISGLLKLASGEITYDGNLISKMEAHKIVRLGLAQVPEGRRVFSGLTVQQNLSMGAYTRHDGKDAIQSDYDMVFDLLPRLKERRNQPAGTLSGGEQQMLAVGRALMCKPKILLLDEPSMGLSPLLVKEIFKIIRDINRQGVTVLLVFILNGAGYAVTVTVFFNVGMVLGRLVHPALDADNCQNRTFPHAAGQIFRESLSHCGTFFGNGVAVGSLNGQPLGHKVVQRANKFKIIDQLFLQKRSLHGFTGHRPHAFNQVAQQNTNLGIIGQAAHLYTGGKCFCHGLTS